MTARLTKVRTSVSIHAHHKVRGLLEGEYAAVTSGRSMEFNDLREYVRGDDVKDIDWKATARSVQPLVKRYVAVRQHSIQLAVSTGRSMAALNDLAVPKRDLAVLVAGVVGWLAVRHGDRVALVHGDAQDLHGMPPGTTEVHLERCLARVDGAIRVDGPPSDLAAVLDRVARTVRRRSILLVVGDDPELSERCLELLRRLAAQHEVLHVTIGDLDPTAALVAGRDIVDIDSGAVLTRRIRGDAGVRAEYAAILTAAQARTRESLDRLGIVHEHVHDEASAITAVFRLLERHRHGRRR